VSRRTDIRRFRQRRRRCGTGVSPVGPQAGRLCHKTGEGMARSRAAGFTLIEVLMVLGLLVLLTAIAWPIMENRITRAELPESAARVRDMLFMVRAESAMEHRRYRVRFEPDQQHPLIEYEPDPIRFPNEWEAVDSAWARESLLLADIQVHAIRPGRPLYLQAISIDEDPSTLMDEAEEALEEAEKAAEEGYDAQSPQGVTGEDDIEIDETRPMIVFEADGSTEWATLVLARLPLDEELEEEHEQAWVVLDGRTGLAMVRELVTEEQLADPEFYVQREKLDLPDTVDQSSLTFKVGGGEAVASGDSSGEASGESSGDAAGGGESASTASLPDDAASVAETIGDAVGEAGSGRKGGGDNPQGDSPHGDSPHGDSPHGDSPHGSDGGAGPSTSDDEEGRRGDGRNPRQTRGG